MSALHFPLRVEKPLRDMFSEIPDNAKAFIKAGFAVLDSVSQDYYPRILREVVDSFTSAFASGDKEFASQIRVTAEQAKPLIAAATLLAMALSSREEPTTEVISAAVEAGIIENRHKDAAVKFASVVKNRSELKNELERLQIGEEVLPSLTEFETVIDVRLGFDDDRLGFGVPVVLVHLDTDAYNQEVWFQLTKKELEKLTSELQTALRRLEQAEKWVGKIRS